MANILVNMEKGIEIGAEDVLKWLTGANKALHAAPEVVAALGHPDRRSRKAAGGYLWRRCKPPEHCPGHPDRERSEGYVASGQGVSGLTWYHILIGYCGRRKLAQDAGTLGSTRA